MESYDGEAAAAPRLVVEYTVPGGPIAWHAHETKTITGTTNTTNFTVTLSDGDYRWNCLAYDDGGNSAFAPADYFFNISTGVQIYYTLTTAVVGNGSVNPSAGSYLAGTVVSVEATPDSSYEFDSWSGDVPSGHENDNPVSITMNANKTITATFIEQPASPGWMAYNDLAGTASADPATNYHSGNSGYLKNYDNGETLDVSVAITGGTNDGTGPGVLPAGTDAYNIFNGKINPDRVLYYNSDHVITFTGLDPSKTYRIVHWADRAVSTYTDRFSKVKI
jgi:hypothetical protein